MSDPASAQDPAASQITHSPAPAAPGSPPTGRKRSKRKAILIPAVLAVIGLALLLVAFLIYPRQKGELQTPPYSRLLIGTTSPISTIGFTVVQVSRATAELKISVDELSFPPGQPSPSPGTAAMILALPYGVAFRSCPAGPCTTVGKPPIYAWRTFLVLRGGHATTDLFVKASTFGVAYNDVTAAAAIPDVIYRGPGSPIFVATYSIPSASAYDWSSFPTGLVSNRTAGWEEAVASGETAGRVAVGINHAAQTSADFKNFLAGALVGLAGGAILSALQEAMHADD